MTLRSTTLLQATLSTQNPPVGTDPLDGSRALTTNRLALDLVRGTAALCPGTDEPRPSLEEAVDVPRQLQMFFA